MKNKQYLSGKVASVFIILSVISPIRAQAFNPFTSIGSSIFNTYINYVINPLADKISSLFPNSKATQPSLVINENSKSKLTKILGGLYHLQIKLFMQAI